MNNLAVRVFATSVGCGTDVRPDEEAMPADGLDASVGGDQSEPVVLGDGGVAGGVDAGAGSGAGPLPDVNGCSYASAQDFTGQQLVVRFPGLSYMPRCARIRAGQTVTFSGTFADHPLRAGTIVGGVATPASQSPITSTSTGSAATFTFSQAGAYPYYCLYHYAAGMAGAIYVLP
jgi:plastocyanin